MDTMTPTIQQLFARRLKEIREAQTPKVSQAELARRMKELGFPMDRLTILKIERAANPKGKRPPRRVTIDEAFAFAVALSVSPLSLLSSDDKQEEVVVARELALPSWLAVGWLNGDIPLRLEDVDFYVRHSPGDLPPEVGIHDLLKLDPSDAAIGALFAWMDLQRSAAANIDWYVHDEEEKETLERIRAMRTHQLDAFEKRLESVRAKREQLKRRKK